jgi:tetratricopeptide (TPR) repeat protein
MKRLLLIIFIFLAVLPAARYAHGDTMDHLEQAYHAQREGDYESAIDHYSRLLKERTLRTSHRAVVYLLRGECYKDLGKCGRAIRDFDRALKLKLDYPQAYYFRGVCHEAEGRLDEAIKDVAKAVDLKPDRELYQAKLARLRAAKEQKPPTKLEKGNESKDKKPETEEAHPPAPKPEPK